MKRTTFSPAVLAYLEKDRIATLNLVGILQNEPGMEILVDDEESPKGVLAKGPWFWYVHTADEIFLENLFLELEQHPGFYRFSGVWRPIAEQIKSRFPLVWDAPCQLYHLPVENHRPELAKQQARSVDLRDAEIIDQHYAYRHSRSLEKIQHCIQQRNSSAIYVDGHLASWLLVHEDNSLGIMYTLEEHRRQGYAVEVTLDLVRKQLAEGKTPFLQIRDDNGMSPGLARRCGFVPHGSCDWFGVLSGIPQELIEGGRAFRQRILEALGEARQSQPDGEITCLCRFLYVLGPQTSADNPVVEAADEEEWLTFAARHLDGTMLRSALAGLGKRLKLLCERRDGAICAVAALLVNDDDGCELVWFTHRDAEFLERVLRGARALGLGTAFVHVSGADQALFEDLAFRRVYTERERA